MKKKDSNGTLILAIKRGDEIKIEYSKREIINKIVNCDNIDCSLHSNDLHHKICCENKKKSDEKT